MVKLWDVRGEDAATSVGNLTGHKNRIVNVKFSPTVDNLLGSASGDKTVKLWFCGVFFV